MIEDKFGALLLGMQLLQLRVGSLWSPSCSGSRVWQPRSPGLAERSREGRALQSPWGCPRAQHLEAVPSQSPPSPGRAPLAREGTSGWHRALLPVPGCAGPALPPWIRAGWCSLAARELPALSCSGHGRGSCSAMGLGRPCPVSWAVWVELAKYRGWLQSVWCRWEGQCHCPTCLTCLVCVPS